jgi:hypothetical protein
LAEANGVFALGDAIELLELGLVDALHQNVRRLSVSRRPAVARSTAAAPAAIFTCLAGEVKLNGLDTNVGGTRSHICKFRCGRVGQEKKSAGKEGGVHRSFK